MWMPIQVIFRVIDCIILYATLGDTDEKKRVVRLSFCEPAGARTQDPILKRDVLYLLSY